MAENATATIRVLVVSRDLAVLRSLWSMAESNSWRLETAGSGWEALERIQSGAVPDLLLLDRPRGDSDGLYILRWLRRLYPGLPIILLSYAEDTSRDKEAVRLGAQEYLVRPFENEQIESAIQRHLSTPRSHSRGDFGREDLEDLGDETFFPGASPIMQKLRAQAELLAQADVPVLIVGEPGSGRETTARLIHRLSVRSGFRFLKVNCAALPGDLLERELFGYATSVSNRGEPSCAGKFELCDKGTLFLDEIVEMPIALQEKLLRLMQEKQFMRPGSASHANVDVRILVSSDINIDRATSENKLREDLYYRLSAFTIHVPALRQRRDEIGLLLHRFMHKLATHYGLPQREFSPAVVNACQSHGWPGNVRELENFVKSYLMIGDEDPNLCPEEAKAPAAKVLFSHSTKNDSNKFVTECDDPRAGKSLKSLIREVKSEAERNAIAAALDRTGWNRKAAARLLKVSYRTMLYKIDQYRITCSDPFPTPFADLDGNVQPPKSERKSELIRVETLG